jgi:hypothetical protein
MLIEAEGLFPSLLYREGQDCAAGRGELEVESGKSKIESEYIKHIDMEMQRFVKLKGCFSPLWKRGAGGE